MPSAVILAAGAGSRLRRGDDAPPKPLTRLLGSTLVERTIASCCAVGVDDFVVVVGHRREELAPYLRSLGRELGVSLRVVQSPRWRLGNGASALASEPYVDGAFFLLMSDHVFSPAFLRGLLARDDGRTPCTLVVDPEIENVRDVHEATKVRLSDGRISAISKQLSSFDAVDTGVFLCRPPLFGALREAATAGEHLLGAAVQLLAARGEVRWASSGGLFWQDIDTPEDLAFARSRLLADGVVSSGVPAG